MAHLLMLHGHPVGYLPPTMASEILYDNNNTVAEKIDDKVSKSGDTMTGNLNVNKGSAGGSNIFIGGVESQGAVKIYDNTGHSANVYPYNLTADRQIKFPDKAGNIVVGQVSHFNCTGVASTYHSQSGWYYADYEITLNKTYGSNAVVIVGHQRGVPFIDQADISGNKLYVRIWSLASFESATSFAVNVFLSENETITT